MYKILTAETTTRLSQSVNELLKEGWEVVGNLAHGDGKWAVQVMKPCEHEESDEHFFDANSSAIFSTKEGDYRVTGDPAEIIDFVNVCLELDQKDLLDLTTIETFADKKELKLEKIDG